MTESVPAVIYEVVDSSNETYWTLGVFPTLAAVKTALDGCNPDDLPGDHDDFDDYCKVEVRERCFGWGGVGKTVQTCEWRRVYREADDEYVWQQEVTDVPVASTTPLVEAPAEQSEKTVSVLEGIAEGLRNLDWCLGYELTVEQCVQLDALRDQAFSLLSAKDSVVKPIATFATLMDIARRLRDQDNRCTHEPMFCVQQKRREVGFDPAYSSETVWVNMQSGDYEEVPPETPGAQEFGYKDYWETVMVCFTEQGCQDYLKANGHNLKETRIYVESFSRCDEMIRIRHALLALSKGARE
jgi:hypothetical protein